MACMKRAMFSSLGVTLTTHSGQCAKQLPPSSCEQKPPAARTAARRQTHSSGKPDELPALDGLTSRNPARICSPEPPAPEGRGILRQIKAPTNQGGAELFPRKCTREIGEGPHETMVESPTNQMAPGGTCCHYCCQFHQIRARPEESWPDNQAVVKVADREGFEPSVRISAHTLSRRAH